MQCLLSVITDKPDTATPAEMAAIDVQRAPQAGGARVLAGGLQSPDAATGVDGRSGKAMFTDGPFAETKEFIAGFWVIDAPDIDTALNCPLRVEALQSQSGGAGVPLSGSTGKALHEASAHFLRYQ